MRIHASQLQLSATDLAGHLGCKHLTQLERLRAEGRIEPPRWQDPAAVVLRERGMKHEQAYLAHLTHALGLEVENLEGADLAEDGFALTGDAMRRGAQAIAQAPLVDGRWRGRVDVLLRTATPSELGPWSYIVADTKLANETRGVTVLQLCLYSDVIAKVQSALPKEMLVVSPRSLAAPERLRTTDFMAYYRLVRSQLEEELGREEPRDTYPEPVDLCATCRWWSACDERWRRDDHLSLVAGVTRLQRRELDPRGIDTLARLAETVLPLDPKPARGSPEGYEKARDQARIQLHSRAASRPLVEPLPVMAGLGLARLPEPSPGDVFLDLEGDPFVEGGGLEYLFGWVTMETGQPSYHARWAISRAPEKEAFEALVDEMLARWERHPGLHIYHFHSYEPSALKRLMGRHATRAEALDRLLRAQRFVDLHLVVRQGLRVGVESYGLKQLEAVHGFERAIDLREASRHKLALEMALELADSASIQDAERSAVEAYNRDDCLSTWKLRDWLEEVRAQQIARGVVISRPALEEGEPSAALDERTQRIRALEQQLVADVPAEPAERSEEQHGRWLIANLLEWHRREDKSSWWEFFRLAALSPEELRDEKHGLWGLELVGTVPSSGRIPVHRYRFPVQDHDVRRSQDLYENAETKIGSVEAVDPTGRTIDVKKTGATKDLHPFAVFAHERVPAKPIPETLERIARWVIENGIDASGPYRAGRDLLLKHRPRLAPGNEGLLVRPNEAPGDAARRLALALDHGVLPIQGPPGTGKTHTGARMICELVRAGRKVGVTAVSHKVIRKLLDTVLEVAKEEGLELRCIQKPRALSDSVPDGLVETKDNDAIDRAMAKGQAQVAGGTAWLWAREDAFETLDVLVIDEAGQMSLANALAASQAARSVILLGDPQQLEQPIQGSHPPGCDASALDHLLAGHSTMPPERGLFLGETWRLHPTIAAFTSELFYEGRLLARENCERQRIVGPTRFAGSGLRLCMVDHVGNQTSSPEEIERVAEIVAELTAGAAAWINVDGQEKLLALRDILVVSPYNAQVAALSARLPGLNVGTVDKFQGQEAAVVIYAMATSSADEAPRGMEFLFSLNRLNVATSRARCVCIVVASPRLLEPECRTPHQMRLANALCRYRELARPV